MTRSKNKRKESKTPPEDDYDVDEEPVREVRKDGWPVEVPVLVEKDMAWNFSTQSGRHDLMVWLERTFNPEFPENNKQHAKAYRVLCEVITERFNKPVKSMWLFLEFTKKNKLPCLAWQAACWNEMLLRLGYDVPKKTAINPGFKPL